MKRIIIFLLLIIVMSGCEYKLHDNYVDNPPHDVSAPRISLNSAYESDKVYDGDTVYIYGNAGYAEYNIEMLNNKDFVKCVFKYDNEAIELTELSGNFHFPFSTNIENKLTCDVYVTSGSGSIADQLNVEANIYNYSWSVAFDLEPEPSLTYRANDEGFLEFSWKRPPIFEERFKNYILYINDEEFAVVNDINQTSYVIKSYSGGECYAKLMVIYDDNKSWSLGYSTLVPRIYFDYDYSEDDSITVSWTNIYNAATSIIIDNDTIAKTKGTSARIPYSVFGSYNEYVLYSFTPYDEDNLEYKWSKYEKTDYAKLSPGIKFFDGFLDLPPTYNIYDDVLYYGYNVRFGYEISCWQFPEMNKRSWQGERGIITSSYIDSKIAIMTYDINVFYMDGINKSLSVSREEYGDFKILSLTNDNKLVTIISEDDEYSILVFNDARLSFEKKISVSGYLINDYVKPVFISPDAKYIFFSDGNVNINILKMDDYNIAGVKVLAGSFVGGWCFNTMKSEQLFVSDGESVREYNSSDLNLMKTWDYPDMKIGNIDAKTGNLLVYDSNRVLIIDTSTKEVVYERVVNKGSFYLYSNTLISGEGLALNLDKYIKP